MKTNEKICSKCGEEFELRLDHHGFATICPDCNESGKEYQQRAEREAQSQKERAAAEKENRRSIEKGAKDKREREELGIEIVRRLL